MNQEHAQQPLGASAVKGSAPRPFLNRLHSASTVPSWIVFGAFALTGLITFFLVARAILH
jgi:hypothetical protein